MPCRSVLMSEASFSSFLQAGRSAATSSTSSVGSFTWAEDKPYASVVCDPRHLGRTTTVTFPLRNRNNHSQQPHCVSGRRLGNSHLIARQHVVHVLDRADDVINARLLPSDLRQHCHHRPDVFQADDFDAQLAVDIMKIGLEGLRSLLR